MKKVKPFPLLLSPLSAPYMAKTVPFPAEGTYPKSVYRNAYRGTNKKCKT